MALETALIIPVPAAEPVVGAHRSRLDRAAALTNAVWAAYPSHPPFRGEFADVVPHLTIGHDAPQPVLAEAAASVTPFQDQITSVRLIAGLTGARRWETVSTFSLGPP